MYDPPKVCHVTFKHDVARGLTACVLSDDARVLSVGFAVVKGTDHFNRRIGRKRAMKDATAHISKQIRQGYWETYFNAHPKDKTNLH